MNILIIYATYSGSTQFATEAAEKYLTSKGHTITRKRLPDAEPEEMKNYDLVILSSPGWWEEEKDGQPLKFMSEFMKKASAKGLTYENKKFAILGLGDQTYAHFAGAVDHMQEFVNDTHGQLVIESLRIDRFYDDQDKKEAQIREWLDKLLQKLT